MNLSSLNIIENPYCDKNENILSNDLISYLKKSFKKLLPKNKWNQLA